MNRTLALFLVLVFCLAHSHAASYYRVIKDDINVRTDSTTSAPSLGLLTKKDRVEVLAEQYDWYKIVLPRRFKGFVLATYIDIDPNSEKKGEVIASNLNIRQEPSAKALAMGRLPQGVTVTIRDTVGDWLKIDPYPHATGWVHKQFLRRDPLEVAIDNEEEDSDEATLSSFVQRSIKKLSEAEPKEKMLIQEELAAKGPHVITLLEQYLPKAEDSLVYSVIAVFSDLAAKDPTLLSYFLKKADSDSPRIAGIYLDTLQNVLQPQGPKKAYFYLATSDALSAEEAKEAKKLFQTMYEDKIAARQSGQKP